MKYLVATVVSLFLIGCGGGGGTSPELPAANTQVIGEIFSTPTQLSQSELRTSIGYSGNVATSRAIHASGRTNILDMLFVTHASSTSERLTGRLAPDLSGQIDFCKLGPLETGSPRTDCRRGVLESAQQQRRSSRPAVGTYGLEKCGRSVESEIAQCVHRHYGDALRHLLPP